jgi:hypothetical protein
VSGRRVKSPAARYGCIYKHVDYNWDDAVADQLDPVERLRYRSNVLGDDQRITNTGGGNTSSKVMMPTRSPANR